MADILSDHWQSYGRDYYSRYDYEAVASEQANALMDALRTRLDTLAGQSFAGQTVAAADEFSYQDPVDGSISQNQGVRILFENGGRAVFRLSGTGTMGATLRLYLEQFSGINGRCDLDPQEALTPVREAAQIICDMQAKIGRTTPDVIT